jgi:hypothetical protein
MSSLFVELREFCFTLASTFGVDASSFAPNA